MTQETKIPKLTRIHAEVAERLWDYADFAFQHGYHEDGITNRESVGEIAAAVSGLVRGDVIAVPREEVRDCLDVATGSQGEEKRCLAALAITFRGWLSEGR